MYIFISLALKKTYLRHFTKRHLTAKEQCATSQRSLLYIVQERIANYSLIKLHSCNALQRYNILPTQYSLIRTYGDLLSFMKSLKYEQELCTGTLRNWEDSLLSFAAKKLPFSLSPF